MSTRTISGLHCTAAQTAQATLAHLTQRRSTDRSPRPEEMGRTIRQNIERSAKREAQRRRGSILDLMAAQKDAAAMETELASLGARLNTRVAARGAGQGDLRERLQQAQRRTASAFLTGDAMAMAARLAEMGEPELRSSSSSSSSDSEDSFDSGSDGSSEADPDAWKEELKRLAAAQDEEERREREQREMLLAQREAEQLRAEEEAAAAAAAVAASLREEQEAARAKETLRQSKLREEEERRQEALARQRAYEEEQARLLAEALRLKKEEAERLEAERAAAAREAAEADRRWKEERDRLANFREAGVRCGERLATERWSPRLSLVVQYAKRLEDSGESLLPRVSLAAEAQQRQPYEWSWAASPRGGANVRSARESARLLVASESDARTSSERQLTSSLHRYVSGPVRHTGHRYTQPPRRLFSRLPITRAAAGGVQGGDAPHRGALV